jgi:hypothetical protein
MDTPSPRRSPASWGWENPNPSAQTQKLRLRLKPQKELPRSNKGLECHMFRVRMKTNRQVQQFKAKRRKELANSRAAGTVQVRDFTLAAENVIRNQELDVSRVEVLEHEIAPED